MPKPQLLVISAVLPVPRRAGQNARVYNKLRSFRTRFEVTFLSFAPVAQHAELVPKLNELVDHLILLPAYSQANLLTRLWHRGRGLLFTLRTGLKMSNYLIGQVELAPDRVVDACADRSFDVVVYEYWHTVETVTLFQSQAVPCVIDMHNVLWQSYVRLLNDQQLPDWWRQRQIARYKAAEEQAWGRFDGLITINSAEHAYVEKLLPNKQLFYAPMGIDMHEWAYQWTPQTPPRVGYYGGLGTAHNQANALFCYEKVMPIVWQQFPDAELWLVGSNPPAHLRQLSERDHRVVVTGFVEDIQATLKTLTVALCPWHGRYGFRSRLIELMAVGAPTVATSDAVYGMDFVDGDGLFMCDSAEAMAEITQMLLADPAVAQRHSDAARRQVVDRYDFVSTYDSLTDGLLQLVEQSGERHEAGRYLA